ncbi:hypothetical protein V8E36_004709 [Tilletia maclaganii]
MREISAIRIAVDENLHPVAVVLSAEDMGRPVPAPQEGTISRSGRVAVWGNQTSVVTSKTSLSPIAADTKVPFGKSPSDNSPSGKKAKALPKKTAAEIKTKVENKKTVRKFSNSSSKSKKPCKKSAHAKPPAPLQTRSTANRASVAPTEVQSGPTTGTLTGVTSKVPKDALKASSHSPTEPHRVIPASEEEECGWMVHRITDAFIQSRLRRNAFASTTRRNAPLLAMVFKPPISSPTVMGAYTQAAYLHCLQHDLSLLPKCKDRSNNLRHVRFKTQTFAQRVKVRQLRHNSFSTADLPSSRKPTQAITNQMPMQMKPKRVRKRGVKA